MEYSVFLKYVNFQLFLIDTNLIPLTHNSSGTHSNFSVLETVRSFNNPLILFQDTFYGILSFIEVRTDSNKLFYNLDITKRVFKSHSQIDTAVTCLLFLEKIILSL